MNRYRSPIAAGAAIGLLGAWPTYQFGFICCFSPPAISALIGAAAGFLATSLAEPRSQDEAAEAGALSSLVAGMMAITGFFLGQLRNSLIMDFRFPLTQPRGSFAAMLRFAIDSEPLLLLQRALTILIGCVFLLTFVVTSGAITGFLRARSRPAGGQATHGA